MRYSELIRELKYWKEISGEEDPEVVINFVEHGYTVEIDMVEPCMGVVEDRAIGLNYN